MKNKNTFLVLMNFGIVKSLSMIILFALSSPVCFSQTQNNIAINGWESKISTMNEDYVNVNAASEQKYKIGLNPGYHFHNLDDYDNFTGDIILDLYLGFILSDEVSMLMGFSYWKAETQQPENPEYLIPSETINSKAFKLGFEFLIINIYDASFLLEPSVSIGSLTGATNAILAFGADIKLSIPLWQERISIITSANYQNGSELLNLGGGGVRYSFFGITVGLEIFI